MIHINRNGSPLGVYPLEEVNALFSNGTLRESDLAWQEGMAEWVSLSRFPGVQQVQAGPPPIPGQQAYAPPVSYVGGAVTPTTSGMAIASMVLGILALVGFFMHVFALVLAILAIIFGHISRGTIAKSGGRIKGAGMALAGLITGYIAAVIVTILLIVLGALVKDVYDEAKKQGVPIKEQIFEELRKQREAQQK